jgi:hypothetical protein
MKAQFRTENGTLFGNAYMQRIKNDQMVAFDQPA